MANRKDGTWRFERGLGSRLVGALNSAYDADTWWTTVVHDRNVLIAIRDGYLNVYYCGASLMKVDLSRAGRLRVTTHIKYLVDYPDSTLYTSFEAGEDHSLQRTQGAKSFALLSPSRLDKLKNNAKRFTGVEKSQVHAVATRNTARIMDLEAAFVPAGALGRKTMDLDEDSADARRTADRIDLVALMGEPSNPRITFIEAKDFSNKELRAAGDSRPAVLDQVDGYSRYLHEHEDELRAAYQQVASEFLALRGVVEEGSERAKLLAGAATRLLVDAKPQLLIFGASGDQQTGPAWRPHEAKIRRELRDRFTVVERPHTFTIR